MVTQGDEIRWVMLLVDNLEWLRLYPWPDCRRKRHYHLLRDRGAGEDDGAGKRESTSVYQRLEK